MQIFFFSIDNYYGYYATNFDRVWDLFHIDLEQIYTQFVCHSFRFNVYSVALELDTFQIVLVYF